MKLWSDSWGNGDRIPERYAAGKPDGNGGATFSDNLNPHFEWSEVPAGTQSFALICHDFDVPSRGDDVNQPGREVPADLPRTDFFHWILVDVPASCHRIAEGAFSRGFTARGKSGPQVQVAGFEAARQGLNDYTGWFAGHAEMAGSYFGYDGPFPPWNDERMHHYHFVVYALDVPSLELDGDFTLDDVRSAIEGHVLDEGELVATYTLKEDLL